MSLVTGAHSSVVNDYLSVIDLTNCKRVNKNKKIDVENYFSKNKQ
jgi:hypothetical protein